ncbi:hypothetical protein GN958_ATG00081 [Phytophthora infestans]|uniref:Uncharacterized protein n=1 Tax=Phytophthora infestans TaxID=4787 RepID=A0A8S9VHE4_PHYIN|nr:hypothetical protein GN958_ATG17485 [Phytophthora infestans]KAF4150732.1 hypothetical protein GN958_ATG00081 [Phytophthora infestans]
MDALQARDISPRTVRVGLNHERSASSSTSNSGQVSISSATSAISGAVTVSSGVSSPGISGPVRVQALVASIITAGSIVTKGKQCSAEYAQLAEQHAGVCAKTFEEYEADMERYKILRDVGETGLPQKGDEREDTGLYFCY